MANGPLTLCQGLQIGAAMALFGRYGFVAALAPTALARRLSERGRAIEGACLAVLVGTALLWPALVAVDLAAGDLQLDAGDPLRSLLLDTGFGHVWLVRLGLVAALAAAVLHSRLPRVKAALAALVLGSLGLVGHAAAADGLPGWGHRACQALHLLSAGAWVGSLVPLLATLDLLSDAATRPEAVTALKRFSVLGHGAVVAAIATGVLDAVLVRGSGPPHPTSAYDRLLIAKVIVVMLMIAAALFNRYVLVPRLKLSGGGMARLLRRLTLGNLALGIVALGLASLLGSIDPA